MMQSVGQDCSPALFRAIVALGSNLGDARQTLQAAWAAMDNLPWTRLEHGSRVYVSAPVDAEGPDFHNAVVSLLTALGPHELLHALQAIELQHGRERPYRHAPRTLDLDLIWMADASRRDADLLLPHPRWQQRAFVVEPMAELVARGLAQGTPADLFGGWPTLPDEALRAKMCQEQPISAPDNAQ